MLSDLGEFVRLVNVVLLKGGWVVVLWALVYMFYHLYMDYIQEKWYLQLEWVFLKVTAPKGNDKSPLAFEQIFNQLHSVHATHEPGQIYFEGRLYIWFTWEVVSIGGAINNYVKILKKHRDILEAAVYSQFPDAEITEAEDYFEKLPRRFMDVRGFDIFAFSVYMPKDNAYPIRTYLDFEHSTAETFVDPVTGIWEEMAKMNPYEMLIVQFFLRPIDDDDWKKPGYELVQKLKGVPEANKRPEDWLPKVLGVVFGPILDAFIRPGETKPAARKQDEPPSLMLHL